MISILQATLSLVFTSTLFGSSASDGKFDYVDFYGLRTLNSESVQELLDLYAGTSIEIDRNALAEKLRELDEVDDAVVILMSSPTTSIALVGIREKSVPILQLRSAPEGDFVLPHALLVADRRSLEEQMNGFSNGFGASDRSEGHSLSTYEPARAFEEDLVQFAAENVDLLRNTLRYGRRAEDRAVAARAIAFAANKQSVVSELTYAITDPDASVRNNAVRALSVMSSWSNKEDRGLIIDVDPKPLIAMLESLEWTDRNKSAALLDSLTVSRPTKLLRQLRSDALPALTEMALWHSRGHALFSLRILARLADLPEEELKRRSLEVGEEGYEARAAWVKSLTSSAHKLR